ncbi:MAG: tRNA wybutosine-synthesizing 3 family protein [Candidatus Woesearchaeota archaeon]
MDGKDFDFQKKICLDKLYKPDRSRKGDVDAPIIPLIDYINSLNNFYTTSSCSGRIQLLTEAEKKPDVKWLHVSHELFTNDDTEKVLKILNSPNLPADRIWLREENLILHVACRTMDDADKILKIVRDIGFRRSGVIADSNIIIVEICSTEKMDVPLSDNKRLVVDDKYVRLIINIANEKFSKGREKLVRLEKEIRERL